MFKELIADPKLCMIFREEVLQPGGTRHPVDMLRKVLGRDPSFGPFFKILLEVEISENEIKEMDDLYCAPKAKGAGIFVRDNEMDG